MANGGLNMIKLSCGHKYKKTKYFLDKLKKIEHSGVLHEYGNEGVRLLREATPKDTGLTSESWYYDIVKTPDSISLVWKNKNIQNGVPIAIILQYGHATRNGGYVEGIDYINPVMGPLFDRIEKEVWKEVTDK